MKFRTELQPPALDLRIDQSSRILLLGSCFSDGVGSRLRRDGFKATVNPTGTLYNPLSIARTISIFEGGKADCSDMFENQGLWRSFDAHSLLSDSGRTDAEAKFRRAVETGRDRLAAATHIFVTFGTAWVFELPDGRVVCNCHKLPANRFVRRRLSVDEIVQAWLPLLRRYSDRRFLFTVSPIRHLADGLHGNQLSKATLMLAVDALVEQCGNAEYFPAYEALVDDLRDYRFYAPDMKHPTEQAVDYVYDLLAESAMSPKTRARAVEFRGMALRQAHRPLIG